MPTRGSRRLLAPTIATAGIFERRAFWQVPVKKEEYNELRQFGLRLPISERVRPGWPARIPDSVMKELITNYGLQRELSANGFDTSKLRNKTLAQTLKAVEKARPELKLRLLVGLRSWLNRTGEDPRLMNPRAVDQELAGLAFERERRRANERMLAQKASELGIPSEEEVRLRIEGPKGPLWAPGTRVEHRMPRIVPRSEEHHPKFTPPEPGSLIPPELRRELERAPSHPPGATPNVEIIIHSLLDKMAQMEARAGETETRGPEGSSQAGERTRRKR